MRVYEFIRLLSETPAFILVGILALVEAIRLWMIARRYWKVGASEDWWLHLAKSIPYYLILVLSVFMWQFVSQETGYWLLILAGTPLEAILGYWYYRTISSSRISWLPPFVHLIWYIPFVMLLSLVGTFIFVRSAELTDEKVHPLIFLAIWMVLAVLTIAVGKATFWYIEKVLKPMVSNWRRRQQKLDEEEKRKREIESIIGKTIVSAGTMILKKWRIPEKYKSQIISDLRTLAQSLSEKELKTVKAARDQLIQLFQEFCLADLNLKVIIEAASDEIAKMYRQTTNPERFQPELEKLALTLNLDTLDGREQTKQKLIEAFLYSGSHPLVGQSFQATNFPTDGSIQGEVKIP